MAYGSLPGDVMVPYPNVFCELSRPPLPAATTTTMPAFQAASTAWLRGSVLYDCVIGRPNDRFITRMLYLLLSAMARLMPAITEASVPTPFASRTFRLIMLASM